MPLYHYTDINAVQSVITKGKLWLTHLSFMNDKRELVEGLDRYINVLKTHKHNDIKISSQSQKEMIKFFEQFKNPIYNVNYHNPIFVFSFCRHGDLLNQWRSYGLYEIQFDNEILYSEYEKNLYDCDYENDDSQIEKLINSKAYSITQILKNVLTQEEAERMIEEYFDVLELVKDALVFKHSSFKDESEVRLIKEISSKHVKYRNKNNILIPYIELDIPKNAIKGIRIGPMGNQKLAHASLLMFLRNNEEYFEGVDVTTSDVPYREL